MSVSRPTCDPSSSHLLTAHRTSAGSRRAACGRTRPRHAALIGYRPHPVEIERSRTGPGLAAGDTFSCPGRTLPVLLSTQRAGRYAADHPTLGVVAQHDPSGREKQCALPGVPRGENLERALAGHCHDGPFANDGEHLSDELVGHVLVEQIGLGVTNTRRRVRQRSGASTTSGCIVSPNPRAQHDHRTGAESNAPTP